MNIYRWISSPDLIRLILEFRSEFYLQEQILRCEQMYEKYNRVHNECSAIYNYYDIYIVRSIHRVVFSFPNDFYLSDLMRGFVFYNGHETVEYMRLNNEYMLSKQTVDRIFDLDSSIFCLETIAQIRTYNTSISLRKLLNLKTISLITDIFEDESERILKGIDMIRQHILLRLTILQFIVRWVCNHTIYSLKFWVSYYFQNDSERLVYDVLNNNRKKVKRFLNIKLV